jgi:alkanesulfonate monooxygenase SsuD/methylene tetrahydromethanopterin reductase-like flavin-dependent oxidoreductase (luciferase family)
MKFGISLMNDWHPSDDHMSRIAALVDQARLARQYGFDSLWVLQHYLSNLRTMQPLPLLSRLVPETGDMSLGTNIMILPLSHPVALAEEFATLDLMSGGRAIAGLGLGYREHEFRAFRTELDDRVELFEENVAALRALWSGKHVTLSGARYDLEDAAIGGLEGAHVIPLWVGAGPHRAGAARAARLGDAWIVPPQTSLARIPALYQAYRDELARLGKSDTNREYVVRRDLYLHEDAEHGSRRGHEIRTAHLGIYGEFATPFGGDRKPPPTDSFIFGDSDQCVSHFQGLKAAGVTKIIVRMQWPDLPVDEALHTMDIFASRVMPKFR